MHKTEWAQIKELFHQTLGLGAAERAAFLAGHSETVRREVAELIASHESAEDFIARSAADEYGLNTNELIGKQIGNYKLLEVVGTGGMGTVFRASRDGYEKEFAVKLIKRGMDTDAVLRRFQLERRILSRLAHPNIAGLIDGGTTEDGLPYFVLEFVDGVPVTHFCSEQQLDTRQRLELFRQVCSAVSYAHQNLVVHRDLKPSNILVTADGTPKLLDFGIAKLLSSDDLEVTVTQARMFTPEYASPEQLNGLPVTTAADVYSLGVVLYELLSGQRPFRSNKTNSRELVERILTEEPPRPSTVVEGRSHGVDPTLKAERQRTTADKHVLDPARHAPDPKSLRGDLDNIVLKALRKEPERRYQTVQELAEDIRRFLNGFPVSARDNTAAYLFKRFVKRHKVWVSAAGLVLISLLTGITLTIWQASVAERERRLAEARFNQVRKLAGAMLFDYQERIKDLPGATETRRKIVTDALEYLDNLAAQSGDSPDLQRELALAYQKVAEIQSSRGEGNVGDAESSFQNLQKAVALQEKLVADKAAGDSNDKRVLAGFYLSLSEKYSVKGDLDCQDRFARLALKLREELLSEDPNRFQLRSDVASAKWSVAMSVRMRGDYASANTIFLETAGVYEALAAEDPEQRAKHLRNAALVYKTYGAGLAAKGDNANALAFYQKALAIDETNAAADPLSVSNQLDLSFSLTSVADSLRRLGNLPDAAAFNLRAIEIQQKAVNDDPANSFARVSLIKTLTEKAAILAALGKRDEAISFYQRSISDAESISRSDAQNADKRSLLSRSYAAFGEFLLNSPAGNRTTARQAGSFLEKGISILEELQKQNPLKRSDQENLEKWRNEILKARPDRRSHSPLTAQTHSAPARRRFVQIAG